jgi:large subunit ribosomal protein L49
MATRLLLLRRAAPGKAWVPRLLHTSPARREATEQSTSPSTDDAATRAPGFRVFRSNYNELPVYHDYKNGRTRRLTLVRKYAGDAKELARELARVCEQPKVEIRTGRIEIKGLHKEKVVAYLESLGF